MKTLLAAAAVFALVPAWGQAIQFDFAALDALAAKAKEKVEVTLEGDMLKQALNVAKKNTTDDKEASNAISLLSGISRVMVRSFEFAQEGAYQQSDLDGLRKQVASGTGWSRIIDVVEDGEHTEIYGLTQGGQMGGFFLISAEKKELTIVHIQGSLQLAQLAQVRELVQSSIQYDTPAGR